MSIKEAIVSGLFDVIGIEGVSITALIALLAIASIASKLGSIFAPASKAVNAGSTVSDTLAYIKVLSIAMAALTLAGIVSIHPDALQRYIEMARDVDWQAMTQLGGLFP